MTFSDELASLRSIAGKKRYRLEKALIGTSWYLVDEATGERAMSDRGTIVFTIERAIKFLEAVPEPP